MVAEGIGEFLRGVVDQHGAGGGKGEEILGVREVGDAVDEFVADTGGIDDDLCELGEEGGGESCGWALADENDSVAVNSVQCQDAGEVVLDAALGRDAGKEVWILLLVEAGGEKAALSIGGGLGWTFGDEENEQRGRMVGRRRRK